MKFYKIHINGRVQGVAFRYYSKQRADDLGLVGTTENQVDGSVVIFIGGEEGKLKKFIEWCYEGSPASKVKDVNITELENTDDLEFEDFSILR